MPTKLLVVSIDGVAPRFVTPATMPHLLRLARQGASTFDARTVHPSITLPAHTSMLRGIDPSVHGIFDNTPLPLADEWVSFLRAARLAGLRTAALLNWAPINAIVEPDAADDRYFLDGGYGGDDDARMAAAAPGLLHADIDVAFAYLVSPDLAGHDHGWGSPEYLDALSRSDAALAGLLEAAGDNSDVLVTTDHGGHGHDHQASDPIDMITFAVLRASGVAPRSTWERPVSVLDVAPTVAAIAGFDAPSCWVGKSLLEGTVGIADQLVGLVGRMADEHYGEALTMLEHSLQTAARLEADANATDDLALAGLLHDIGHLLGEAGDWGFPEHAEAGAVHLQAWLPPSVVEPIRLHVAAKRHLVATDPDYAERLSEASTVTLAQQGGPLSPAESVDFEAHPWSADAIRLRQADEAGKQVAASSGELLDQWRDRLDDLLRAEAPPVPWLRDACCCAECRDGASGQRLLDATSADGWFVAGRSDGHWVLRHQEHGDHVVLPDTGRSDEGSPTRSGLAGEFHPATDVGAIVADLAVNGFALATGLPTQPGEVLNFARQIGFVRETNYGDLFDVRNEPDPSNLAYTPLGLPLHTDNPYRDPVPGVQLLHCLVPALSGGESTFADGFAMAEQLRAEDPGGFALLASTPVRFEYRSEDTWLVADRPVIDIDSAGRVVAVAVNHRSMQVSEPGPATSAWYEAYRRFVDLASEPQFRRSVHLQATQVALFDNRRVLHARSAFDSSEPRHLQGCYIDLDAVRSTARLQTVRDS